MKARVAMAAGVLLAALADGCGGGAESPVGRADSPERVVFAAADGVQLEGRLLGEGRTGVALAHMGRPGDSQRDWYPAARVLAATGFTALTFNRRGVCPGDDGGCSGGTDDYGNSWQDIVAAYDYLRGRGVERVVLAGASIGAMSSIHAAQLEQVRVAGLIEVGGINHASGYSFEPSDLRRIEGRKLFVSTEGDAYGGADWARHWHAWATPPKRLAILPGALHGTDILGADGPAREPLTALIVDFAKTVDSHGAR